MGYLYLSVKCKKLKKKGVWVVQREIMESKAVMGPKLDIFWLRWAAAVRRSPVAAQSQEFGLSSCGAPA